MAAAAPRGAGSGTVRPQAWGRSTARKRGGKAREGGGARRPPLRISTTSRPGFCSGRYSGSAMECVADPIHPPEADETLGARAVQAVRSAPGVSPPQGCRAVPQRGFPCGSDCCRRPCHRGRGSPGSARRALDAAAPFPLRSSVGHPAEALVSLAPGTEMREETR